MSSGPDPSNRRLLLRGTGLGDDATVRCFLMDGDTEVREMAVGLNFHWRSWRQDAERLAASEQLLLVQIPQAPIEVPTALLGLDPTQEVVLRDATAEFDVITTAAAARLQAEQRIQRARRGQLSSREAAALLAELTDDRKSDAHRRIVNAFATGALVFRDVNGRHIADPSRLAAAFGENGPWYVLAEIGGEVSAYTTRDELRRWLAKQDHPDAERLTLAELPRQLARPDAASRAQHAAIIRAIEGLGWKCHELPASRRGAAGPRKAVQDCLAIPSKLFASKKAFWHAWEALLHQGTIAHKKK